MILLLIFQGIQWITSARSRDTGCNGSIVKISQCFSLRQAQIVRHVTIFELYTVFFCCFSDVRPLSHSSRYIFTSNSELSLFLPEQMVVGASNRYMELRVPGFILFLCSAHGVNVPSNSRTGSTAGEKKAVIK